MEYGIHETQWIMWGDGTGGRICGTNEKCAGCTALRRRAAPPTHPRTPAHLIESAISVKETDRTRRASVFNTADRQGISRSAGDQPYAAVLFRLLDAQ
jgi:hypothetical protein